MNARERGRVPGCQGRSVPRFDAQVVSDLGQGNPLIRRRLRIAWRGAGQKSINGTGRPLESNAVTDQYRPSVRAETLPSGSASTMK